MNSTFLCRPLDSISDNLQYLTPFTTNSYSSLSPNLFLTDSPPVTSQHSCPQPLYSLSFHPSPWLFYASLFEIQYYKKIPKQSGNSWTTSYEQGQGKGCQTLFSNESRENTGQYSNHKIYIIPEFVHASEIVACFKINIKRKLSPCQGEENVVTRLSAPVCMCLPCEKCVCLSSDHLFPLTSSQAVQNLTGSWIPVQVKLSSNILNNESIEMNFLYGSRVLE